MAATANIRLAVQGDADLLPDIERSAGKAFLQVPGLEWVSNDDVWSADEHRDWMARGVTWVAEDGEGKLIGFLIAQACDTGLHIWEISVHADAQGKGIGPMLMNVAEQYAIVQRLDHITLTTFRDLRFNEKFYKKLGFQTLTTAQISPRLQRILEQEAKDGLPLERRCAMRKPISSL